ncbi:MAG TPA: hypothetical protein VEF34_09770 [Syntrophobacteraceae bacterium]|nr:hypothetical protein [Syntrophobacteraceae bacterium]
MEKDRSDGGLGCCACKEESMEHGLTCADKQNIFTRREQEVLERIRAASLRATALRDEMRQTEGSVREAALLELERLRQVRAELEKERLAASEERMRLLGHL